MDIVNPQFTHFHLRIRSPGKAVSCRLKSRQSLTALPAARNVYRGTSTIRRIHYRKCRRMELITIPILPNYAPLLIAIIISSLLPSTRPPQS